MKIILITTTMFILTLFTACTSGKEGSESGEKGGTETTDNESPKGDAGSDDWIMGQLREKYPEISDDDVCIVRPQSFNNVALVGMFAHDRGCGGSLAYFGGEKGDIRGLAPKILNDNGWSDRNKRSELALNYTKQVIQVWDGLMEESTENFDSHGEFQFSEPLSTVEDGEVTVTCWVKAPAGMLKADNFYHLTVVYSGDGEVLSKDITNRFSVEY